MPAARTPAASGGGRMPPEKMEQGERHLKTEYLLGVEVDRVLAALTPANRLVMRVALHTGLRVGDVLALRTDQIGPQFWITEQKTGKRRRVGLTFELLADLRRQAGRVWVFESRCDPARHRTRQAVWADVKRAAQAFRLPQNIGPHSARKVYAVALMAKYGDLKRVQRALNHRYESTTIIYALADMLLQQQNKRPRRRP